MNNLGKIGEDTACDFLEKIGHKIIERNWKTSWGEIDIISKDKNKTLVFTEVKTLYKSSSFKPEDHFNKNKKDRVATLANFYANSHRSIYNEKDGWRIDLIAVEKNENEITINHYPNILL